MSKHWKGLHWSALILIPVASLVVAFRAEAQEVRVIQAPAPYNACNLRSGGGVQYSVLGTFRNGTSVTLLGEYGRGWYRVQVQQETGWIARQCLGL
ncbi:MAG: SH3 domain-containing protein [Leptolyngbya sp. SIO3F4]|nr:SH3 domain-containing protein [Leptolyngbya sp. SIO3F4]